MTFTGSTRAKGLIEDDIAQVAGADIAVGCLWARLRTACYRPRLTRDDIDDWSRELREIEAGLAAGRRGLQAQREEA